MSLRTITTGWLALLAPAIAWAQPEEAEEAIRTSMTLTEIIQTGGWPMYVLGLMSLLAAALIIYFFVVLRQDQITPRKFTRELNRLLASGSYDQARLDCRQNKSPVAAVALAALDYAGQVDEPDPALLKEIIEGEGSRQANMIQSQTSYLLDIGVIAPMIGLLGTVLGMLTAFNAVALDIARAKPIYLAAGVSQALVTTAAGLIVGIPAMIFYSYFRGRTSKLISDLEAVSADMLTHLIQKKN
jgi:biopolymer transport protein ExbB